MSAGLQEFNEKFVQLVQDYKPTVPAMLNLAMNIIANALWESETREESEYYAAQVDASYQKIMARAKEMTYGEGM